MGQIVCFGEIMGRLCPPGYKKILQASSFDFSFAGAEANVAVSLANYGLNSKFISKIPDNDLGKLVQRILRSYNVNTSGIVFDGERLGMYYFEKGASQRPSKVIYDRKYSSFSMANNKDFDWDRILENATWFHTTGITPALSDTCIDITKMALIKCKEKGITVSFDLNYRKNLWASEKANKIISEFMEYVDICIGNEEDAEKVLGIRAEDTDVVACKINKESYKKVAEEIAQQYKCRAVAITFRESYSASINGWSAMLFMDGNSYFSKKYDIQLVDRIGGGDSFAGALIYALIAGKKPQDAIEFAVAASCLKHTIEGDFNQASIRDVELLAQGDSSGRVQR